MKKFSIILRFQNHLFVLLAASLMVGCSPTKEVTITSNPTGANLYIDGTNYGRTPVNTKLKFYSKTDGKNVKATEEGYKNADIRITYLPKDQLKYSLNLEKIEIVNVGLVTFEPLQTNKGVKLSKIKHNSLAYLETIERSPNVKSVTKVTQNEERTFQFGKPVMSPIDNSFVYEIYAENEGKEGYCNIWRQGVGGVSKIKITQGQSIDVYPAFSRDGEYIYFSSNRITDNPTIWKIRAEGGGGLQSITKTLAEDYVVSVFPNDVMLAYASHPPRAEIPQIWTVNITGTLPTQLKEGELPCVSPDGKRILYQKEDLNTTMTRGKETFHPMQIWVMNIDGGGETQLTQNTEYNNIQPEWSPDGKWIVFTSDQAKDLKGLYNWDIWMMKADGTAETQLTTNGSWDDSPSWSYDGQRIYFRSNRGGYWNIWYFEPIIPR